MPAPRNACRHVSSSPAPNCVELPDRDDLLAANGRARPDPTPSSSTTRGAATSVPSPRTTPSPTCAPWSRSARTFSSGARARNASGSERSDSRNAGSSAPTLSSSPNDAGSETPSVETPASGPALPERRARDELLDVLLRDEPALVDLREVDAVALGELDGLPRRLALALRRLRRRLLAAPESSDASSSAVSAMRAIVFPSSTSTPSSKSCTIVPAPGASISTVAFVVSTTTTGCPVSTSERSATSHSARSANSVFASSRVRTISSTGASFARLRARGSPRRRPPRSAASPPRAGAPRG